MASFLWKGTRLERELGKTWFLYLLSVFTLLTGLIYLLLEILLTEITQDEHYSMECAVGFSGVLFALKVLINHYYPGGVTYLIGVPVSNRYASWAELVLIHLTVPGSSFVGHLSGILVGLLYTRGPLKEAMKKCADIMTSRPRASYRYSGSSGVSGYAATAGGRSGSYQPAPSLTPDCTPDCTAAYTGGLTEEEQLDAAISNSENDQAPPEEDDDDLQLCSARAEVVRQMRLKRFDKPQTRDVSSKCCCHRLRMRMS